MWQQAISTVKSDSCTVARVEPHSITWNVVNLYTRKCAGHECLEGLANILLHPSEIDASEDQGAYFWPQDVVLESYLQEVLHEEVFFGFQESVGIEPGWRVRMRVFAHDPVNAVDWTLLQDKFHDCQTYRLEKCNPELKLLANMLFDVRNGSTPVIGTPERATRFAQVQMSESVEHWDVVHRAR